MVVLPRLQTVILVGFVDYFFKPACAVVDVFAVEDFVNHAVKFVVLVGSV